MSPYRHVPHPHILHRKAAQPAKVADQFSRGSAIERFNTAFALKITAGVGSMWCAYIFAAIAAFGLPSAIHDGVGGVVQWIAQTFLQLVLLSIIMVGQRVLASASDKQALQTFRDAEAVLGLTDEIHRLIQVNNKLTDEIHHAVAERNASGGGAVTPA